MTTDAAPSGEKPILTKVSRGKYLTNVECSCGGLIRIEKVSHSEFKWESFCDKCFVCDCNGWPTLQQAASAAREYFTESN